MTGRRDHYSYSVYADPTTAHTFDERRFGGPIGELVASQQAAVIRAFAQPIRGCTVLDVGTGTGRAAILLALEGAEVTGIDASEAMLAVARHRAVQAGTRVAFALGDAHALDVPDRSFDLVISLRVLMHSPRWRQCLHELCRVAGRRIIVDYPSSCSVALLQAQARRLMHALGGRAEPYRVFSDRQIADAFERMGFRVRAIERQFVLPIALHKAVGSPRFTQTVERVFRRAGLLAFLGSPVTLVADRA